jgi:hypothetical protein
MRELLEQTRHQYDDPVLTIRAPARPGAGREP